MPLLALLFAALQIDKDQPHRDWGQVASLSMTVTDATACIVRRTARNGASAQVIPADGGNDIDYRASAGLFGGSVGKPWMTYQVRQKGEGTTLTILYRHPYRKSMADKQFKDLQKHCLRVSDVRAR